jgi:solute carrier family 25 2-oxodicarboxylate transporter 21
LYAVLTSAFIVAVLLYPLDVIRALQMASVSSSAPSSGDGKQIGAASVIEVIRSFIADHGVSGLFKQGLLPEVLRATWTRFLKFSLFPVMLAELGALPGAVQSVPPTLLKVLASCLSAIPEAICVMPIEAAKLELQLDKANRHGNQMHRALISTFRENGAAAVFLTGFWAVLYRQASWTATYFASITFLERTLMQLHKMMRNASSRDREEKSRSTEATTPNGFILLISGFIAGVLATFANTPGDTVRTVMQVRGLHERTLTQSTLEVARDIILRKGVRGLFSGFEVKAVILGLGGALMAVLVPFFDRLIKHLMS